MAYTLLRIDSSIFGPQGQSAQLAEQLSAGLLAQYEQTQLIHHDFSTDPLPHLDQATFSAFSSDESALTAEQKNAVNRSNQLIAELKQADALVISAPMYNFTFPSTLKAWMDNVARAGHTFQYTANGPAGLIEDKPVYVITTRGGQYKNSEKDFQVPLIKLFFNFLGLTKINIIYAENLAVSEARETSIEKAQDAIQNLLAA